MSQTNTPNLIELVLLSLLLVGFGSPSLTAAVQELQSK